MPPIRVCLPMLAGLFALGLVTVRPCAADGPAPPAVSFDRQIRPILAENCFACHGPDEKARKAKLRLDTRDGAFGKQGVIVPGQASASELVARITHDEPSKLMPPVKSNKKLKPEQIQLLRRWIDQGAPWTDHWAFVAPQRPALSKVADEKWVRNAIDRFILARLDQEGLKPAPEAAKTSLVRRVTLDLTGLPPTPAEVDAFLAASEARPEAAYEELVDRLLASPRFGEHMARYWLDAARYGDTHGLHLDNYREIWPYRDWVVRAFNDNMPYDRFVIEQLAGDLLPNPTLDQIVATGYNRCHVTTSEGGSIEEEVYVRNVVDQVDTNGMVLLGLATGCARCHDHKYDPIRMKDYYQLFAFFNSIDGKPLDGNIARHEPVIRITSPEQAAAFARIDAKRADVRQKIAGELARVKYDDSKDRAEPEKLPRSDFVWIDDALPAGAKAQIDGATNLAWSFADKSVL